MSVNIRFPNITAATDAEQLIQIKSYLHQLVEQLNWALATIESGSSSAHNGGQYASTEITPESFYELKSLIIQSTDTLNAYYDKINSKLEGQYVSQTDFDAYTKAAEQAIKDLDNKYVSQADFDAHVQEAAETLDGLDDKYVLKTDFDAYVLANDQNIADLMESIDSLNQRIDSMQETGGE